jgi:hypothetical protein
MNRGNFVAGLAGPDRPPVLELERPLQARTIILKDGMEPGWLAKLLAANRRRPLQLLWPDRTPAVMVFPNDVRRETGAVSAPKRHRREGSTRGGSGL